MGKIVNLKHPIGVLGLPLGSIQSPTQSPTKHRRERHAAGLVPAEALDADQAETFRFMHALRLIVRTLSLGDVHSPVAHPAATTQRNLGEKRRRQLGIRDNLARFPVGIEDRDDITADIEQALATLAAR